MLLEIQLSQKNQRFQEFPQVLTLPLNFWELYIQTEGCVVPENRLCNILGWPSLSMIGMSIVAKLVLSGSFKCLAILAYHSRQEGPRDLI